MMDLLIFKKRPGSFFSALRGLLILRNAWNPENPRPPIRAQWTGAVIDKKHLKRFNDFFNLPEQETLPFLYPYTLFFPIYMRMLTDRKAPMTIFRVLNSRNHIIQHRSIGAGEILDIRCESRPCRPLPRGLEMDISTVITSRGETVWENINTFHYRGSFGGAGEGPAVREMDKIRDPREIARFPLPGGQGFRFSRIIGDSNPIHYSRLYARLFGFRRDFAQPFLVLNRFLQVIPGMPRHGRLELRTRLKGQLYYGSPVVIKGARGGAQQRFDIYSDGQELPAISVEITAPAGNKRLCGEAGQFPRLPTR